MKVLSISLDRIWEYMGTKEQNEAKEVTLVQKRRELLMSLGINVSDMTDDAVKKGEEFIVSSDQLIKLLQAEESLKVKQSIDLADTFGDTVTRLEKVLTRAEELSKAPGNPGFNERVEVYTPGAGLMLFNATLLLEDSCTDTLQGALDDGWRIIAACPQPDSRRPDYILGRYDPTREVGQENRAQRRV